MSSFVTKPDVKSWDIADEEQATIENLNPTSEWLRNPPDPEALREFEGKYVAARNCQIIAAAETYDELRRLLIGERAGSYMVASFKEGKIVFSTMLRFHVFPSSSEL